MGEPIEIVTVEPATTAVVRGTVPMDQLANFFDRSFGQLGELLGRQQIKALSPAFARYHGMPGETVDVEVGFVTDRPVEPEGHVLVGELPGGPVARTVHAGSFDTLGESWGMLRGWLGERGRTPQDSMWEVYVTEPNPDMDPADLRTELNWPLYGSD